jgi:death on curing protein
MSFYYLTFDQILETHQAMILAYGGLDGILQPNMIQSAIAQPSMTFDGIDLYPSLEEKAAALAYSIIRNHGFRDGNKRVGMASIDLILAGNGHWLNATVDEVAETGFAVADGSMNRDQFTDWIRAHTIKFEQAVEGSDSHGT